MTNRSVILFVLSLFSLTSLAQDDFQLAQDFMQKKGVTIVEDSLNRRRAASENYNIFKGINDKGFAIVVNGSIIGYSTESNIDADNLPDGLMNLINHSCNLNRSAANPYPEGLIPKNWEPVEPLVSAMWSQGTPYKNDCPVVDGKRCVTGCVPTAIAMLMYYYQYPTKLEPYEGNVIIKNTEGIIEESESAIPEFEIQWDKMLDSYDGPHTEESEKAVSEFLVNLGYRLQATYGVSETVASGYTLFNNIANIYSNRNKKYTDEERDSIFYISLLDARPIYAEGYSIFENISHAFLIDGCDSDGLYHINWGWGGYANGYFIVSQDLFEKYKDDPNERDHWSLYNGEPLYFYIPFFPKNNIRKPMFFTIDGVRYHITSTNTVEVVEKENHDYKGNVNIPATINYEGNIYNVTSIVSGAFRDCNNLKSIIIPNSVTAIGDFAFDNCCDLTSIIIPNSVISIGVNAFDDCSSLRSITIGEGVTSIGVAAFKNCSGLTSIVIPNNVSTIGNDTFNGCKNLASITIGESVTSIGAAAFKNCSGLTSIIIPNNVSTIGNDAFNGCNNLTSITIGKSVKSVGLRAFDGCNSIETITFLCSEIQNKFSPKTVKEITTCDGVKTIGNSAFEGFRNLISVTISNSVTSIGNWAFGGCCDLTSITIGESVTFIGKMAFTGCKSLISIIIPNSVTALGEGAFEGCSGLTSITIGEGVTSIGEMAFTGVDLLEILILSSIPPAIDESTFEKNTYSKSILYVPYGSKTKYSQHPIWGLFKNIVEVKTELDEKKEEIIKIIDEGVELYTSYKSQLAEVQEIVSKVEERLRIASKYGDNAFDLGGQLAEKINNTNLDDDVKMELSSKLKNYLNDVDNCMIDCLSFPLNYIMDKMKEAENQLDSFLKSVSSVNKDKVLAASTIDELTSISAEISNLINRQKDSFNTFLKLYGNKTLEKQLKSINANIDKIISIIELLESMNAEIDELVGLEQIIVDDPNTEVVVYTMEGIRIKIKASNIVNFPKGVYIINGKKVVIN